MARWFLSELMKNFSSSTWGKIPTLKGILIFINLKIFYRRTISEPINYKWLNLIPLPLFVGVTLNLRNRNYHFINDNLQTIIISINYILYIIYNIIL